MSQKVLNKRSSSLVDGEAKLPTASQIDYGEIAVNFADGHETLSIKNNNNEIATFSSDEIIHSYVNGEVNTASGNIKTYVDNKISSIYKYKGSVANYSNLPSTDLTIGDVYNVVNANGTYPPGTNYAWTGTEWDALGGSVDLSNYVENSSFTSHTSNTTVHVSSSEKSTWNGKQDAISDLSTIRTNAENGANAYQNMITGVTINGSAATVTNKNASINIETGGSGLPSVTSSDNGKILQVVNGQWELVTPSTIYTGQGAPDNLLGIDGDIYLQTS